MRKLIALTALVCLCSHAGSSQTAKGDLIGTWKLISSVGKMGDGGWNNDSSKIYQVKTITPSYFMFTIYDKASDSLAMSAQGKITVNGKKYTEMIDMSSNRGMIGKTYTYTSTVKGNRWHIEGGSSDFTLVEDWIKVQ